MNIHQPQLRFLIMTLCIMMLVMRLGGAHLHLCLDGGDVSAVHYEGHDSDQEHVYERGQAEHHDINIDLSDSRLVKKTSAGVDLLGLLLVAVLWLVLPREGSVSLTRYRDLPPFAYFLFYLLPPLRGPPSPLPFASRQR